MERHETLKRGPLQKAILNTLLESRGSRPAQYALLFVTGDGWALPMPDGEEDVEALSGQVLDQQGRVHYFQLGWDVAARAPALTHWELITPEPHCEQSAEYRRARERVGLQVA